MKSFCFVKALERITPSRSGALVLIAVAAAIAFGREPDNKEAKFIGTRYKNWNFQKVERPPVP